MILNKVSPPHRLTADKRLRSTPAKLPYRATSFIRKTLGEILGKHMDGVVANETTHSSLDISCKVCW